MARLEIPAGVTTLIVWVDRDNSKAGETAAHELARSAHQAGVTVFLQFPPGEIPAGAKGLDWLDVYNAEGAEALELAQIRGEPWKPPSRASRPEPSRPDSATEPELILDPADPMPSARKFVERFHTVNDFIALRH
jgi:hypothetical protein